ncbi:MAG: hypothetical protein PWP10_3400 [Clostridiales bacterium]|nr:hypothetical protein [Clostridiales bacterium]
MPCKRAQPIINLAQKISRNPDLIPVERHGQEPGIHVCESGKEEYKLIRKLIRDYNKSDYQSLSFDPFLHILIPPFYHQSEKGR